MNRRGLHPPAVVITEEKFALEYNISTICCPARIDAVMFIEMHFFETVRSCCCIEVNGVWLEGGNIASGLERHLK